MADAVIVEEHEYKTAHTVALKVWTYRRPDAPAPAPAIVFFFGGGWQGGTPTQFEPQCRYLAGRGMVAMAADYRVRSRHGTTPLAAIADARSATRWVRGHAEELGVDPHRIAAGGGSSGGHLAACAALITAFDAPDDDPSIQARPDALVLFNPVLDLTPFAALTQLPPDRLEAASPLHHVAPAAPPAIIFHGTADATVPYAGAEAFTDAMCRAGNHCELVGYPGAGHGFFNHGRGDGQAYTDTLRRTDRFLTSLGFLGGQPTL